MFFRNYSYSTDSKIDTKGTICNNPLDKEKNIIVYNNVDEFKKDILEENKVRSGIYMFTNKETKDIYIGQSKNLYNRFKNYLNPSYLRREKNSRIGRAILKYGYSSFSLTILEYCDKEILTAREQFYFDSLNPTYNILRTAGAYVDVFTHSDETKIKIRSSLKGIFVGEKAPWFGRKRSEETKALMSLKKSKSNNPLFGKDHSEETKELMRQKALGRKHSEETKLLMSTKRGIITEVYEKSGTGFKLIGSFTSARQAGKYLGISASTINKYLKSGEILKNKYKFKSQFVQESK